MSGCASVRSLLGAAALGLLDERDAAAVVAHVTACPGCAAERARLEETVALMDLIGDGEAPVPSPALEQAVLDRYARDRRQARRHPRRRLRLALAGAAAAVLLAAGGLAAWLTLRSGDAGVTYTLAGVGPAPAARGEAQVSLSPAGTAIHLTVRGLPPSREGLYEMWFERGGLVVSAGTFRVGRRGAADVRLTTAADPREYAAMGVTREPDDDDPARNGVPVLRGRLDG
jgi:hypothetical protein